MGETNVGAGLNDFFEWLKLSLMEIVLNNSYNGGSKQHLAKGHVRQWYLLNMIGDTFGNYYLIHSGSWMSEIIMFVRNPEP